MSCTVWRYYHHLYREPIAFPYLLFAQPYPSIDRSHGDSIGLWTKPGGLTVQTETTVLPYGSARVKLSNRTVVSRRSQTRRHRGGSDRFQSSEPPERIRSITWNPSIVETIIFDRRTRGTVGNRSRRSTEVVICDSDSYTGVLGLDSRIKYCNTTRLEGCFHK